RTPRAGTPAIDPPPAAASRPTPRSRGPTAGTRAGERRPLEARRPGKRSRLQTRGGAGPGLEKAAGHRRQPAAPARTVMHACFAFHPELHGVGPQVIAAPMRRPRDDDVDLALRPRLPRQR